MSQHPFNILDHIRLNGGPLSVRAVDPSSMSGSGGTPPKKKAPVKRPGKPPKKK